MPARTQRFIAEAAFLVAALGASAIMVSPITPWPSGVAITCRGHRLRRCDAGLRATPRLVAPPAPSGPAAASPYGGGEPGTATPDRARARRAGPRQSGCLSTRWPSCGASRAVADREGGGCARVRRPPLPWPADPGVACHASAHEPARLRRRSGQREGAWRPRSGIVRPSAGHRTRVGSTHELRAVVAHSIEPTLLRNRACSRSWCRWGGRRRDRRGHDPARRSSGPTATLSPALDGGATRVGHSKQGRESGAMCCV